MFANYYSLKKAFLLLIFIYLVYLTKTALGINLLDKYHAPQFVKYPLVVAGCAVEFKVNFCKKTH